MLVPGPATAAPSGHVRHGAAAVPARSGAVGLHVAPKTSAPAGAAAPRLPLLAGAVAGAALRASRAARASGARRLGRGGPHRSQAPRTRARAVEADLLAEAKAAAEGAKLELEAAKLRAEAEVLERAGAVARRTARAYRLLGAEGSVGVGFEDLRRRLKEDEGFSLTEEQVRQIVATCSRSQEETALLMFDELSGQAFEAALQRCTAEARQQEIWELQEAANRAAQQQRERGAQSQDTSSGSEEANDDRGQTTRILACLTYLLTLSDGFKLVIPISVMFPPLAIMLAPVGIVALALNAIPFGSLICFVLFITLAQNKEIPRLVRFNLEQAVLLDVALIVPNLLVTGLTLTGGVDAVPLVGALFFFALLAVCVYCVNSTLGGKEPDGIPVISNATKNVIDRATFFDKP